MPRLVYLLAPCAFLSGCFAPGDGLEVPQDEIYFPVGLAVDRSASRLFVVSSDFDLQYNGGAIQSYDLAELSLQLADKDDSQAACPTGEQAPSAQLLYPGRCLPMELTPVDQVKIGAFATDLVLRSRPQLDLDGDGGNDIPAGPPERLLVPVRGDTTLHWLDVEDGVLECGQAGNDGACDNAHRAGQNAAKENTRDLNLAAEPFAIDASQDGRTIVVTNQTSGTASLFVDDWSQQGPFLRFALASESIPSRPVGIVNLPRPGAMPLSDELVDVSREPLTPETFLMTFRNSAQVRLVRFAGDGESTPEREYLIDNGGVGIDANSVGSDSRGIAIDPSARELALARCGDGDGEEAQACRDQAVLTPIDVYVANRSPASLLIGRTQPPLEYPYFFQSLPLTTGPSRVVVGKVRAANGELEVRVFVVCFDSRRIFVYDPQRRRFEAEILTGRGPHAVAIDTERALMYVGHFTDSFVGVFSLDLGSPASYGSMLGMLGTPKAPRSSK